LVFTPKAFATRGGIKKQDFSPEQMRSGCDHKQLEMKTASNIDLKFFMEENTENDEAFYATLDDQDSINSENMTSYPKSTYCHKGDDVSFAFVLTESLFTMPLMLSERHADVLLCAIVRVLLRLIEPAREAIRDNRQPLWDLRQGGGAQQVRQLVHHDEQQ
jgi:hypothetical protein